MNKLYEALEKCLESIERGADVDSVLDRYPDLADELRPILEASVAARGISVPGPSAEATRRGRAKLLQRAAELRETKKASRPRMVPVFQRLAMALTLAAIFLMSGTGLVRASASALPGEGLYPVKRTWEGLRLIFAFDAKLREVLQSEFEIERLHEVNELLNEGRHETIQFAGVLTSVNGVYYVSGIHLVILDSIRFTGGPLQNGAAVIVTGRTNAEGFVEAQSIQLLPPGSLVPAGNPIEIETAEEEAAESSPRGGSGPGSRNEANTSGEDSEPPNQSLQMEGKVESVSSDRLVVNGQTVYFNDAEIRGAIVIGAEVKLEGYFAADGRFMVTKVEVENEDSDSNDGESGSDSGGNDNGDDDNTGTDDDDDHDDESNDDDSEDDDSGHGDDDD